MHLRRDRRRGSLLRRACAAFVLAALTVSCGSSTDVQDHTEAGSYVLVSVNGQTPPVTITGTSYGNVVIQGGFVTLTAAGTDTYTAVIADSASGSASAPFLSDGGTYSRSGSTLTFHSSSEPIAYSGTYDQTTGHITVSLPGAVIGVAGTIVLELAVGGLLD